MISIYKVQDTKSIKEFLEFPSILFNNQKAFIRPLDVDIEAVFSPKKNPLFQQGGMAERFLFKNERAEIIARVAVFINPEYRQDQKTAGFGFFDVENNPDTGRFVLQFVKNWALEQGAEALDGAINFGERDRFWGLGIEGFQEPLYGMHWHPPYYKEFIEDFGFQIYFKQYCYARKVHDVLSERFIRSYEKLNSRAEYRAVRMTRKNMQDLAPAFLEIYNTAWATHGEGKQLMLENVQLIFRKMKPVINEHVCWFVFYQEQPIAFWMNLPDLNFHLKNANGKLGIKEKVAILLENLIPKNKRLVGIVFGVIPRFQGRGVEGFLISSGSFHIRKKTKFEVYELQWIGDFNPKMISIAKTLDTEVTRVLATYRLMLKPDLKFQPHPQL